MFADAELGWKKLFTFLSTFVAGLLALPGMLYAQAQRMSADWMSLTPADPKAPIPVDPRDGVVLSGDDGTTVSIERRSIYRSRSDSVAAMNAYKASKRDQNIRLVVSLEDRKLWVMAMDDTLLEAPIAVGSGERLVFGEKAWRFDTPRGIRTVRGKDDDPHWTPPEWHYAETATEYDLRLEHLSLKKPYVLSDGRKIMFQNGEAGVLHPDSGFMYLPLEEEIVFENTLFVPPVGSKNRQIQGELGKYKLDTGGGILLHGTPHLNSIGQAATHGCLRLRDEDIEWLYQYIPVGTRVYIY